MGVTLREGNNGFLTYAQTDENWRVIREAINGKSAVVARGFFSNPYPDRQAWRFPDRVFIGEAATNFNGDSGVTDGGDSWTAGQHAFYLPINSALAVHTSSRADGGKYAITGYAKLETGMAVGAAIGVAGALIMNKASGRGWALYSDVDHKLGDVSNGCEFAIKNSSADNLTYKPYTPSFGTFGSRYVSGGDPTVGDLATNPSTAAIIIIANATPQPWNSGIVFGKDALTGTTGLAADTGTGVAIALGRRHAIQWHEPGTSVVGAYINSSVTTAASGVAMQFLDNNVTFYGNAGATIMFRVNYNANTVNRLETGSAGTGAAPYISSVGTDSNVDIRFIPQGTGVLRFGTHSAIAAETVTGYITVKDAGGTSRKLAVVS